MLKISVVTVCLNSEGSIERTIKSVLCQTYTNIEYLIIDGESSDGTLAIINKYRDSIDYFISEKDGGIYNAMNKGLLNAKGDIVFFLHSDDYFFDETVVEKAMKEFESDKDLMIFYGDVLLSGKDKKELQSHANVNRKYLYRTTICHQSIFAKRLLFEKYGCFDERHRICADYDWVLKNMIQKNVKKSYRPFIISVYDLGGVSTKARTENYASYMIEKNEVRQKYFNLIDRFRYR